MWNLITLDGYFEGEKPWDLSFHGLAFDKELEAYTIKQLDEADAVIYGENTYLGMKDYWTDPQQVDDVKTEPINTMKKYVCSTTMDKADWQNTEVIKDAVAEIPTLKERGDGNLFVFGSAILSESLMKAYLFDEYRLCVVPVFLGKGRRLFNDGLPYQKLKLLNSKPLKSGAIILTYIPK
jgi:dihydrofolate reductase